MFFADLLPTNISVDNLKSRNSTRLLKIVKNVIKGIAITHEKGDKHVLLYGHPTDILAQNPH